MEVQHDSVAISEDEEEFEEIISALAPECVRELPAVNLFVTV